MERVRQLVVPAYLILCLTLGGSAQGIWQNMVLQLLALAILVWALLARAPEEPTAASKALIVLISFALALILIQLIPLPPALWSIVPGRKLIADGFEMLGYSLPWMPLSLTPYETVGAALAALPAAAVLLATLRQRQRQGWLAGALLLGAFAAVLLGALQVAGPPPAESPWYLYRITNDGAVGFFANRNHMGSLLLVSIPFALALIAAGASGKRLRGRASAMLVFGGAALLVLLLGIVLNHSLAAAGLAIPVLFGSALLLPTGQAVRRFAVGIGAVGFLGALLLLTQTPIGAELTGEDLASFESRQEFWSATMGLIVRSFPVGTGLGSFQSIYALTQDPTAVETTYVNHAHNDYLEIFLETGVAGLLLVLGFLFWWAVQVIRAWRSPISSHFARAATIASGALLAHSLVDYPLRTAALSVVFGMTLALVAQPARRQDKRDTSEPRPTKHLTIG